MAIDNDLKILTRLFEDDDVVVVDVINRELLSRGENVLNDLTSLFYSEKSEELQANIAAKIQFLTKEFSIEHLRRELSLEVPDLIYAMFYVSKLVDDDFVLDEYISLLNSLVEDMRMEIKDEMTAMEKLLVFNHIFYHRLKFTSREYPFEDIDKNLLISVLKNRHGSPVLFSLVYYLLARAVGLNVYPLVFSNGIVPCYAEKGKALFYIDIIRGGEAFSQSKLNSFLEERGMEYNEENFKVENDKPLIKLYIDTLRMIYKETGYNDIISALESAIELFH